MFTKIIKALNNLVERLTPRQLIFGAAALGLATMLMVFTTMTHLKQSMEAEIKAAKTEPVQMTKAVVAKVNIPRGVIIQENMLTVKEFAVKSLPKGSSEDIENFINLPTKLEIFAGDIMTTDKVFTDMRQAGFIGMIPENCRALTIPVNNVAAVAGWLKAGDRVDIILIMNGEGGTKSEVLMENVLLLSVNKNANRYVQKTEVKDKKKKEQPEEEEDETAEEEEESPPTDKVELLQDYSPSEATGSVTLALKPDEITRITAMTSIGRIYLALRPLKPRSDSMYIEERQYYTATRSSEPPLPPEPPTPIIPSLPPQANVPTPALPVIPNNGNLPTPADEGFEIIKWGN